MSITALPQPPTRSDPVNFNSRADAFLSALPTFATEANELQADVNAKQTAAALSASNAAAAELAANAAANVTAWVSGTTYAVGNVRYSPITFLSYRRKTAGAGTTDPSVDSTNWQLINGTGNVNLDGTQTLTNKTLSTGSNWNGNAVPIANGGTGQTTAANAFNALKQNATETTTGVVELATTTEAANGTASDVVVTPAGLNSHRNSNVLGWNQTWQDVLTTPGRTHSTSYQNTTGRPIQVAIAADATSTERAFQVSIDNITWVNIGRFAEGTSLRQNNMFAIIPPSYYYRISGAASIDFWAELR